MFGAVARELLDGLWREGTGVRLVGVGVSGFDDARPQQLDLFGESDGPAEESPQRDLRALSVATDDIRQRFGAGALTYGRDLRLHDARPQDGVDGVDGH